MSTHQPQAPTGDGGVHLKGAAPARYRTWRAEENPSPASGLVWLTPFGRLVDANAKGREELARGRLIKEVNGQLSSPQVANMRLLEMAVGLAARGSVEEKTLSDGNACLHLTFLPILGQDHQLVRNIGSPMGKARYEVMVILHDPSDTGSAPWPSSSSNTGGPG